MALFLTHARSFKCNNLLTRSFSNLSVQEYSNLVHISDIDLTQDITTDNKKILNDLISKHKILLFNQQLTKATQVADLARIFSPTLQLYGDNLNEIQMYIVENRSKEMRGSDFWHSDLSYHPIPSYCTLLYAMEIPNALNQGNTQFINMIEHYNALSDKLKEYYSTLKGVHNISHNGGYKMQQFESIESPTPRDAIHPLIRVHPITGNKIIYANPAYTYKLIDGKTGNDLENSNEILEEIYDHCISSKYIFEHQWNAGDLLVWDNIPLLHKATTFDMDPKFKRVMLRSCSIGKEPPIPANSNYS